MKELIFMIGVPGCGKSEYIRKQFFNNNDYTIISYDNIREQYAIDNKINFNKSYETLFKITNENKDFNDYKYRTIRDIFCRKPERIVIDGTNIYRNSYRLINRFIKMLNLNPNRIAYIFDKDPEIIKKNNENRNNIDKNLNHLYELFNNKLIENLDYYREYFDEIYFINNN